MAAVSTSNRVMPQPQSDSGPALLVVDDILIRFGSAEDGVTALDNVSFTVAPGEFLAVIGPSGCGKSTLFNIIGGLLGGYDGSVAVAGETTSWPFCGSLVPVELVPPRQPARASDITAIRPVQVAFTARTPVLLFVPPVVLMPGPSQPGWR